MKSRTLLLTLAVLFGVMQATAETWTDSNGITWSFTVNGMEATDIRFSEGPSFEKIYIYGDPNREDKETQLPFQPGIYDSAAMRFSSTEGSHLPTIQNEVYFGLKTLIFDVSDVTEDFDLKVMNAWWSSIYYDHVKWEDGLNYLQITQKMADECARGGQGRDLTLMLTSGSMTFKSVYYETISTPGTVVEIPEKVYVGSTELTVTSIGNYAFKGCSGLASITIPNSVTSIGNYAFSGCSGLTSVTIPNSVTSIGNGAFSICGGLTSIEIPNSVTSIGKYAFQNCSSLTSIEIPNSVTSIGDNAFSDCSSLTSVTIGNSVTTIGGSSFRGCSGLTSITIPSSVTSIGKLAFSDCSDLTSISVESGNTKYDSRDNCNAIIETVSNTLIAGCKTTIIPNSVTSIGDDAFYVCRGLTSIKIPNSVTSIGNNAFIGCSDLTSITIPNSVTSIGWNAFWGCSGLISIEIPSSMTSIGDCAFMGCSGLTELICYANTPPTCSDLVGIDKSLCTLYVPEPSIETYKATEPWNSFTKIVAITITPISEDEDVSFGDEITEETDLSSVVIDNIYITLDEDNGDGYDSDEQALVLSSTMTAEQMDVVEDMAVGDPSLCENYNGIIFKLAANSGIITVDAKTVGTHVLNVQIGNGEPTKVTKSERGTVDVPFEVDKPTYVYIYASTSESSAARLDRAPSAGENNVLLYGYKVTIGPANIPGDVNDDGVVNVTDIVATVNYIMEKPSDGFNKDAADLNGDGEINVTDIVKMVTIIMSGGSRQDLQEVMSILTSHGFIFKGER